MWDEAVWEKTGIAWTDHRVYQYDPDDPLCIFMCIDGIRAYGRGEVVSADGGLLFHGFRVQSVSPGTVGPVSPVVCGI